MAAAATRIRWDRVGRLVLLAVLLLVVLLYVNPLRGWWSTWQESEAKRAEMARLEAENRALDRRRAALHDPAEVEREARRLGMVKPGERPYVVRGLPR